MLFTRRIFIGIGLVLASATPALAFPGGDNFSGLVVWIFCGYCAIIVVAQLFGALIALKRLVEGWSAKKRAAKQVSLR